MNLENAVGRRGWRDPDVALALNRLGDMLKHQVCGAQGSGKLFCGTGRALPLPFSNWHMGLRRYRRGTETEVRISAGTPPWTAQELKTTC